MLEFEDLKKQPMFCFFGFVLGFLFALGFFGGGGGFFQISILQVSTDRVKNKSQGCYLINLILCILLKNYGSLIAH